MIHITHNDTASILLELGDFRILTDPVFDAPGHCYHFGWGSLSRKTSQPAIDPQTLGKIDLVLLSHDQHGDNLDRKGRSFIAGVQSLLTTRPAARRLHQGTGMAEWESREFSTSGGIIKVTAVPARHGPPLSLPVAGKVIGFVLEYGKETIYISGDTVYFRGVEEVARRFKITTAILHVGGVRFPYLTGPLRYTFNAREALRTAALMNPNRIIPIHYQGWTHFREPSEELRRTLGESSLAPRVLWLSPGVRAKIA